MQRHWSMGSPTSMWEWASHMTRLVSCHYRYRKFQQCMLSLNKWHFINIWEISTLGEITKTKAKFQIIWYFPWNFIHIEFAVLHQTTTSQISESCSSKIREMWAINSTDNKSIFRINLILDIYALQIQSKWTLNAVPTVKIHKQWCK